MIEGLPFWPRLLSAELAAAYAGVSKTMFLNDVRAGRAPKPIRRGRRVLWDRVALDRDIDLLSGVSAADPGQEADSWADL